MKNCLLLAVLAGFTSCASADLIITDIDGVSSAFNYLEGDPDTVVAPSITVFEISTSAPNQLLIDAQASVGNAIFNILFTGLDAQGDNWDSVGLTSNGIDNVFLNRLDSDSVRVSFSGSTISSGDSLLLTFDSAAVPEPSCLAMLGIIGLGFVTRRRSRLIA